MARNALDMLTTDVSRILTEKNKIQEEKNRVREEAEAKAAADAEQKRKEDLVTKKAMLQGALTALQGKITSQDQPVEITPVQREAPSKINYSSTKLYN